MSVREAIGLTRILILLARGVSDELWCVGAIAPDRLIKSMCIWLVRGPLFLRFSTTSSPSHFRRSVPKPCRVFYRGKDASFPELPL